MKTIISQKGNRRIVDSRTYHCMVTGLGCFEGEAVPSESKLLVLMRGNYMNISPIDRELENLKELLQNCRVNPRRIYVDNSYGSMKIDIEGLRRELLRELARKSFVEYGIRESYAWIARLE